MPLSCLNPTKGFPHITNPGSLSWPWGPNEMSSPASWGLALAPLPLSSHSVAALHCYWTCLAHVLGAFALAVPSIWNIPAQPFRPATHCLSLSVDVMFSMWLCPATQGVCCLHPLVRTPCFIFFIARISVWNHREHSFSHVSAPSTDGWALGEQGSCLSIMRVSLMPRTDPATG